jgi:hypothetical protein
VVIAKPRRFVEEWSQIELESDQSDRVAGP